MTDNSTPVELVKEAVKETLSSDIFWVVYDREAVYKYSIKNMRSRLAWSRLTGLELH